MSAEPYADVGEIFLRRRQNNFQRQDDLLRQNQVNQNRIFSYI